MLEGMLAPEPIIRLSFEAAAPAGPTHTPSNSRSGNALRPSTLDEMIGQHRLRSMLRRVIDSALANGQPMDHLLLVGASGTGKSTIANIVANELDADVYQVEAPISHETLLELREVMQDGDVLFIDEIHQQAIAERRGKSTSTQPEVLFNVMEDRTLVSGSGVLAFPAITLIGATTDEGMLPEPFVNRFALRPIIAPYSEADIAVMAEHNAAALGCVIEAEAAHMFARASRLTPRVVNNYVRNAASLATFGSIDTDLASEVLFDLNGVSADGLTTDMQNMLKFMFTRCRTVNKDGEVTYKSSIAAIATAIGKSRDQKAVQLRVEPHLISAGLVQVGHGGRQLTDAGVTRARDLITTPRPEGFPVP